MHHLPRCVVGHTQGLRPVAIVGSSTWSRIWRLDLPNTMRRWRTSASTGSICIGGRAVRLLEVELRHYSQIMSITMCGFWTGALREQFNLHASVLACGSLGRAVLLRATSPSAEVAHGHVLRIRQKSIGHATLFVNQEVVRRGDVVVLVHLQALHGVVTREAKAI